ncbi:serine/threonine protein kinase [Corallococcus carmarthensis]|uniref:non-specific serine/threonine protein kinase n=1 Tax=Corallococcus carmarthensis TaxID=2316728 RepID=A0A3A8K3B4_9BACT|nr:serine/threonine protein kinase [Corallococcus carmarthensis]
MAHAEGPGAAGSLRAGSLESGRQSLRAMERTVPVSSESPELGLRHAEAVLGRVLLSAEWLLPGTQVGRWEVMARLGAGGYGTTYSVRRVGRSRGRLYALKLSRRPGERWFAREAELLTRVRHRSVVRLISHGVWRLGPVEHPYLVMEYVEGESLYVWALARNPTARQMTNVLVQVLEALAAAHRHGALHRDFKGDNVLITPDGRVKVLDWGAGWYAGAPPLTATARLPPGSPRYYSPQLFMWRVLSERRPGAASPYTYCVADELYAVGVTFYRLLTDQYPAAQWGAPREVSAPHGLRAVRDLNPHVTEGLSDAVMRMLAFEPERRPESMALLAGELRQRLADGGPGWDAPLFDWRERTASGSRTTVEADEVRGPVMPGQEIALRDARARHLEDSLRLRGARELRRRDPAKVAAAEARSIPALQGRVRRGRSHPLVWGALAVMLVGPLVAGLTVWSLRRTLAREGSPLAVSQERVVQQMASRSGPEEARRSSTGTSPPVPFPQEKEAMTPHSPQQAAVIPMPARSSTLKRCSAAVGAAVLTACTGAQVRPDASRCPAGSLDAMRKLSLNKGGSGSVYTDITRPGRGSEELIVHDGPIVSLVIEQYGDLPVGTRLYGRLWTGEGRVTGRYTKAELPDGRIYPVCFVYGNFDGLEWNEGSKPGAVRMPRTFAYTVVNSFP